MLTELLEVAERAVGGISSARTRAYRKGAPLDKQRKAHGKIEVELREPLAIS
jgi:hypothetical protein